MPHIAFTQPFIDTFFVISRNVVCAATASRVSTHLLLLNVRHTDTINTTIS